LRTTNSAKDLSLEDIGVKVFPNPISDLLNIDISKEVESILISDAMGRVVFSSNNVTNRLKINSSNWADGYYIIQLYTNGGVVSTSVVK